MAEQSTPSGWYPDPAGGDDLRWWDGQRWTDALQPTSQNVHEGRAAATPPAQAEPTVSQAPGSGPVPGAVEAGREHGKLWRLVGLAAVALALVGAGAALAMWRTGPSETDETATAGGVDEVAGEGAQDLQDVEDATEGSGAEPSASSGEGATPQTMAGATCDLTEAELEDIAWAACLGGADGESVDAIALSPDKQHLAVVGTVSLPLPDNPMNSERSVAQVWMLDSATGATVWDRQLPTHADKVFGQDAAFSGDGLLVVSGGYELADGDGPGLRVVGLDASSGSEVYDVWPGVTTAYPYPMVTVDDGAVAVTATAQGVAGISTTDASILWERQLAGSPWHLQGHGERVVASGFAEDGWVAGLRSDGVIDWMEEGAGRLIASSLGRGMLATVGGVADAEAEVRMRDVATGEAVWSQRVTFDINGGLSVGLHPDDEFVVVVSDGEATGFAATDGRVLWEDSASVCCDAVMGGGGGSISRVVSGSLAVERYAAAGVVPSASVRGLEHPGAHPKLVVDPETGTSFASFSLFEGSRILTGTILVVRAEPGRSG